MGRRWFALIAAILVALPVAVVLAGTSADAARLPSHVTLPDLQIEVPVNNISIGTNPDTGDRQLQFTHITWDAGAGPFLITPKYDRRTGTAGFVQTIFKSRGGTSWSKDYKVPVAVNGIFDPPSDYRFPLTRFTLNVANPDGSPGALVATSPKTDYCITADTFVGGVPNSPNSTSPPQSDCTNPHKSLGFSVGWGDEYDQTDNGQPIDLTGIPDGNYVLHAVVDPDHAFTESDPTNDVTDTQLTISGDNVTVGTQTGPPASLTSATLVAPRAGSVVSGAVTLTAAMRTPGSTPVTRVQYLLDGEPLGMPVQSAPFTYDWQTGSAPAGTHLVSVQVTDARGDMATAPVRTLTVARAAVGAEARTGSPPPFVALANPGPGQIESGTVPVAAVADDAAGIRSVQIELDGRPLGAPVTSAPYAIEWNTIKAAEGPHTLTAVATDVHGATGVSSAIPVTVQNPAPPMTCFVLQASVDAHGTGAVTTPAFHTASEGETLLAFVSSPRRGQHVTVYGAGLSWHLVRRANAHGGDAEVWTAHAPGVLTGARVTSTPAKSGGEQHVAVIAMEGVVGVGASSSSSGLSGTPTTHLTTTDSTSLVFATGIGTGIPSLARGWVPLEALPASPGGGTSWTQYTNDPTGPAGTMVSVTDGPHGGGPWNMVAVELVHDDT
jgi:hypothetical protein